MPHRASVVADLFDKHVVVETGIPGQLEGQLFPEEAERVARVVQKRRDEFTAGRLLARRALDRLGVAAVPLLPADDRSPIWPAGVAGTITHTREFCAVAVAKLDDSRCLGLDAEKLDPLKPELIERICTEGEIEWLNSVAAPGDDRGRLAKIFFSAKEAFYKCQYPLTGRFLEFHDVELKLDLEHQRYSAIVRPEVDELPADLELNSRYLLLDGLVICAVGG